MIFYVAVMTEDDQAVTTRGCTGMADEAQYKCSTHTAGGQVSQTDKHTNKQINH